MNNPSPSDSVRKVREFSSAEWGALAHLYRAEVYRSTMWRTRLDNTTNWAVASLGLSISVTFSSKEATLAPLMVVGMLITAFLFFEARRYRYFNVWRVRARWLEYHMYAPVLRGETVLANVNWSNKLSDEYSAPIHRISLASALHRRLARNYIWIFLLLNVAFFGKLVVHPSIVSTFQEMLARAGGGIVPGDYILSFLFVFDCGWILFLLLWPLMEKRIHENPRDELSQLVEALPLDLV